ncbi:MAG: TolB family protein, partial [Chitinophagaceae bacterium]
MRKLIITVPFIFFISTLYAQRFGGTPPSVRWKQINTDSARIIFPEGLDSQAQRVASLVHYQASHLSVPLGDQLKKINIVLQNQTTVSNAYVGLGPYRSEFYLTPFQNNFD